MRDRRDTRNVRTILRLPFKMPGDFCILYGNSRLKATADRQVAYHRNKEKLDLWRQACQLSAEQMKSHSRFALDIFAVEIQRMDLNLL